MTKRMLAATRVLCPSSTDNRRHMVTLFDDGAITCDCADGEARGGALAGRILLGASTTAGARGCGALIALTKGARTLLPLVRGTIAPQYGLWDELMHAYGKNPVFQAVLDLAEKEHPERAVVKQLLVNAIEKAGYKHALGKRRFRAEFKTAWDVPEAELDKFIVSSFDDDAWAVPYQSGWKEHIANEGLAVVGGKAVCGRSTQNTSIMYAITRHEDGQAHWVRPHKLAGGKLVECPV